MKRKLISVTMSLCMVVGASQGLVYGENVNENTTTEVVEAVVVDETIDNVAIISEVNVWNNPYIDVKEDAWYFNSIKKATELGLMKGVTEDSFSPNLHTTKAMILSMLYIQAGSPEVTQEGEFWYSNAQSWAIANDIHDGTLMEENITREELVTVLWKAAGRPMLMDYPGLTTYDDVQEIDIESQQAMAWAHERGIVKGKLNNKLDPKGLTTRAELATIMVNYLENEVNRGQ